MNRESGWKLEKGVKLFLKTAIGNALSFYWLWFFQPTLQIRHDGSVFWLIYAGISILVSVVMWCTFRGAPDMMSEHDKEASTPLFGVIAATFQVIIFLFIFIFYNYSK